MDGDLWLVSKVTAEKADHPGRMVHQVQLAARDVRQDQPRKPTGAWSQLADDGICSQMRERRGLQQRQSRVPTQLRLLIVVDVHAQPPRLFKVPWKPFGFFAEDPVADLKAEWTQRHAGARGNVITHGTHAGWSIRRRSSGRMPPETAPRAGRSARQSRAAHCCREIRPCPPL